ncbi:MAG: glycosyltransferase family 9 protein [Elusimicrobia bacterium]|nr:glycosyltransferase family 9 protein [Elusimicrobiota bacterium]
MTKVFKTIISLGEILWAMIYWLTHPAPKAGTEPKKILVMGYCGLGDMIFLFPMFRALRRRFPGAHIAVLANPDSPSAELAAGNPEINQILQYPCTTAGQIERRQFNALLDKEGYDAVVASASNPIRHFLSGLHKIPWRLGHCRRMTVPWSIATIPELIRDLWHVYIWQEEIFRRLFFNRRVWLNIQTDRAHDIDKCLRLIEPLGIAMAQENRNPIIVINEAAACFADNFLKQNNLQNKRVLAMSLGISKGMPYKQWGVDNFARLATEICKRCDMELLLLGSADEENFAQELTSSTGLDVVNVIGRTNVHEMAALLKKCSLFIGNDTGPAKLAMAVNTPTAMIWGPSDRYGGGAWNDKHLVIHNNAPCSPCLLSGMMLVGKNILNHVNCGHHQCLTTLSSEFAFEKIIGWIEKSKIFSEGVRNRSILEEKGEAGRS